MLVVRYHSKSADSNYNFWDAISTTHPPRSSVHDHPAIVSPDVRLMLFCPVSNICRMVMPARSWGMGRADSIPKN